MLKNLGYVVCAVTVLLGVLIGAPKTRDTGGCLFCGRVRDEMWWCGIKVRDQVREREWSAWVDSLHPGHTNHIWGISSHSHRRWFGRTSIGCGGVGAGGVAQIHFVKERIGEGRAVEFLNLYHSQVQTNRAQLHEFLSRELGALSTNAAGPPGH